MRVLDNDQSEQIAPDAPQRLDGVAGRDDDDNPIVTLIWDPPLNDGGATITHYEYQAQRTRWYNSRAVPVEGESDAWISTRSRATKKVVRATGNGNALVAYVALRTPPMPHRLLTLAEPYA